MKSNVPLKDQHFLVVEDNEINRMVVKHTLQKTGVKLDFAFDATTALQFIKENIYDLVLMDIQLPGMDGYTLTYIIRNEIGSDVPIIAMTAMMNNGEDEKCLNSGMNGYIAKPFTLDALLKCIDTTMENVKHALLENKNVLAENGVTINLDMLYNVAEDDEAYMNTLVDIFIKNTPDGLKKLTRECKNQNWQLAASTAHFLKSSLGIIKIKEIFQAVELIEHQCKHPEKISLNKLIQKLNSINSLYSKAETMLTKHFFNSMEAGNIAKNFNNRV